MKISRYQFLWGTNGQEPQEEALFFHGKTTCVLLMAYRSDLVNINIYFTLLCPQYKNCQKNDFQIPSF